MASHLLKVQTRATLSLPLPLCPSLHINLIDLKSSPSLLTTRRRAMAGLRGVIALRRHGQRFSNTDG